MTFTQKSKNQIEGRLLITFMIRNK